jgi:hypothetical protein
MLAVSAAEMTAIRNEAASAVCDQSCTIKRNTAGSNDGYGTSTESLTTIATTTAGIAEPSASQLANYAYKIGALATWLVQLPYGTSVQTDDLLIFPSHRLVVQVILSPRSYDTLTSVLATEVK